MSAPLPQPPPAWWIRARFGLFIHWGVYAVPGGTYQGRHVSGASEWLMHSARIPVTDYKEFASGFTAENYDADAWVRAAMGAGMGYVVITAKHHDGSCLFETKHTDWNAKAATPAARDVLRPLVDSCRRHGIPIGFYYSHAQDWTHGGATHSGNWDPATQDRGFDDYLDRLAIPQIRELLTNYGPDAPSGVLEIEAGDAVEVKVPPRNVPVGAVMNLRGVYLTPTSSE